MRTRQVKQKRERQQCFLDGFTSAFDLTGSDFERHYVDNNVNDYWTNVGCIFSDSLEEIKSINDSSKGGKTSIRSQQKQPYGKLSHSFRK